MNLLCLARGCCIVRVSVPLERRPFLEVDDALHHQLVLHLVPLVLKLLPIFPQHFLPRPQQVLLLVVLGDDGLRGPPESSNIFHLDVKVKVTPDQLGVLGLLILVRKQRSQLQTQINPLAILNSPKYSPKKNLKDNTTIKEWMKKRYLRNEDRQIVLDEWIDVNNGLVQVFVEDLPGQSEPAQVLGLQVDQGRRNYLCCTTQPVIPFQQTFAKKNNKQQPTSATMKTVPAW